jgi:hypothetical protein
LEADGAAMAASRRVLMSASLTGCSVYFLMLRLENMVSTNSFVMSIHNLSGMMCPGIQIRVASGLAVTIVIKCWGFLRLVNRFERALHDV